ncbi:MAG: O-antigen ligase family protein [Blastocatellia bacterium]
MRLKSFVIAPQSGMLFKRLMPTTHGPHFAAFVGVYLFTLVLWARPHELFPVLGAIGLAKIIMFGAVGAYIVSKFSNADRTVWTLEAWMMLVICAIAMFTLPVTISVQGTEDVLLGLYLKVLVIFVLMYNLIDTRKRLYWFLQLLVFVTVGHAIDAIRKYLKGEFTLGQSRIEGSVDGMFGNPNSLAMALDLMVPVAIMLAFITTRRKPRLFYLACTLALVGGVLATLSRGAFLALGAIGAVLLWKLSRNRRVRTFLVVGLMLIPMARFAPSKLKSRISTIFSIESDATLSAQERKELLMQGIAMIPDYWILGVGMNNYSLYSTRHMSAHNTYLEILIELGILGLIAYLIIIIAPMIALWRIELQTANAPRGPTREIHYLSVGLQASIVGFCICSFFGSVQYIWFPYYIAALGIALKRIHAAEQRERAPAAGEEIALPESREMTGGVLWKPYSIRAEMNPAKVK